MLEHCSCPPGAMVEILPCERAKRAAWKIADGKFRAEPNSRPGIPQSDVKFSILIVREVLIISADGQKRLAVESGVVTMIYIARTNSGSV